MTAKDWILLFVPIAFNGVILTIFQKLMVDKYLKHRLLKDEIVKSFLDKLKAFNDLMIQSNFDSMINGDSISGNILKMQDVLADLVKYFDTNSYDLKKFKKKFNKLNDTWMCFMNTYQDYSRKLKLTDEMALDLGNKMQNIKDTLHKTINYVRKKY